MRHFRLPQGKGRGKPHIPWVLILAFAEVPVWMQARVSIHFMMEFKLGHETHWKVYWTGKRCVAALRYPFISWERLHPHGEDSSFPPLYKWKYRGIHLGKNAHKGILFTLSSSVTIPPLFLPCCNTKGLGVGGGGTYWFFLDSQRKPLQAQGMSAMMVTETKKWHWCEQGFPKMCSFPGT